MHGTLKPIIMHNKRFTEMRTEKVGKPFQLINDARGCYMKLSPVTQSITKGHFERVKLGLTEPFKINRLDFESTRRTLQN